MKSLENVASVLVTVSDSDPVDVNDWELLSVKVSLQESCVEENSSVCETELLRSGVVLFVKE